MKCFVIKNKEGKYVNRYGVTCEGLPNANFIEEEYKPYHNLCEDEYWQEVTLCEGDLEKELAVRDKALDLFEQDIVNLSFTQLNDKYMNRKIKEMYIAKARKELGEKDE